VAGYSYQPIKLKDFTSNSYNTSIVLLYTE